MNKGNVSELSVRTTSVDKTIQSIKARLLADDLKIIRGFTLDTINSDITLDDSEGVRHKKWNCDVYDVRKVYQIIGYLVGECLIVKKGNE